MAKALDGIKYLGKNFWKVLPVGSSINLTNQANKNKGIEDTFGFKAKALFHEVYALAGISAVMWYGFLGGSTGEWNPKQIKQYYADGKAKKETRIMHENSINKRYENIFQKENAKTFQDSVDIYQKYGLPIKLLEPSLNEKEKAIKKTEIQGMKSRE